MDGRWQQGRWLAAGAVAGVLLTLGIYFVWFVPDRPATVSSMSRPALAPSAQSPGDAAQLQAAAPAACHFEPMVQARGTADGQFGLHAALASHRNGDPGPFLSVAEEAGVQGRPRDAEVALIAACQVAARAGRTAPLADVQARLAQHYTTVATHEREAGQRGTLLQRAEALLGESVTAYSAALGPTASRTRVAAQRLAAFRQGAPAFMSNATESVAGADVGGPSPSAEDTSAAGASRHSLADRPPRSDENLGQVESDLERLYAQAQSISRDPIGVQRRHQQALARRQACRDEACLRGWYAQRKRELFDEF